MAQGLCPWAIIWFFWLHLQNHRCQGIHTCLIDSFRASVHIQVCSLRKNFYLAPLLIFSKPLVPMSCNLAEWFLRASCSHPSVFSQKILLSGSFSYIFKTTSTKEMQLDLMIPQDFLYTSKSVLPEKLFNLALLLTFSKPLVPRSCNLNEWFLRASCAHPSLFSQKIFAFGSFA